MKLIASVITLLSVTVTAEESLWIAKPFTAEKLHQRRRRSSL
jgi:hypothetical protein